MIITVRKRFKQNKLCTRFLKNKTVSEECGDFKRVDRELILATKRIVTTSSAHINRCLISRIGHAQRFASGSEHRELSRPLGPVGLGGRAPIKTSCH